MNPIFRRKISRIDWIVARTMIIYLLSSALVWIFFCDFILSNIVIDHEQFVRFSIYSGLAYIVLSSALLYLQVRKTLRQQIKHWNSLQISEERWKLALEGSRVGVWDWTLKSDQVFRSDQWHEIYGYSRSEIGASAKDGRKLIHTEDVSRVLEDNAAHLEGKAPVLNSEFRMLCKDGTWKWTQSRGMVVSFTPEGKPLRMIGTHTDISAQKISEAQLLRLAHYDTITSLPNRILFLDRFEQEIKKAKRTGQPITLMYLDLDRFKEINDTFGHDTGDLLLKEMAQRLVNSVRASDTVARLGGDEFTILMNNLDNSRNIGHVAQEIINKLAVPFQLGAETVHITTSIGITVYPEDGEDVQTLLKNADQAMYAAKNNGRNCYHYFTPAIQQATLARCDN